MTCVSYTSEELVNGSQ